MPVYIWEAETSRGEKRSGEIDVANGAAVRIHLRNLRLTPVKIKKRPKDLLDRLKFFAAQGKR